MLNHIVVNNHKYIQYYLNNKDDLLMKHLQEIFHINIYIEIFEQVHYKFEMFFLDINSINDEELILLLRIDQIFLN